MRTDPAEILRDCLAEAGNDPEAGLLACEYILAHGLDAIFAANPEPSLVSAFFAHDIRNRRAQGVLNRAVLSLKEMVRGGRDALAGAVGASRRDGGTAILEFVEDYRQRLADLLTRTQMAALLEGAQEVAAKVPDVALATDAGGREHRGTGEGGGQFVSAAPSIVRRLFGGLFGRSRREAPPGSAKTAPVPAAAPAGTDQSRRGSYKIESGAERSWEFVKDYRAHKDQWSILPAFSYKDTRLAFGKDGEPIGWIGWTVDDEGALHLSVDTRKDYRDTGVGLGLLRQFLASVDKSKIKHIAAHAATEEGQRMIESMAKRLGVPWRGDKLFSAGDCVSAEVALSVADGLDAALAVDDVHLTAIEEAVRSLAGRDLMTPGEYAELEAAARAKAIAVAGVDATETLAKIRDALAENVRGGAGYASFREAVLDAVGAGTFLSPAHLETVFRTSVQTAFSDGQEAILSHPLVRSGFPYRAYDAVHDSRARENHLALEGCGIAGTNVYRADDPVWRTFRPPWDYNDRCSGTPMTVAQAAEAGVPEAREWRSTGVEPWPPAHVPPPPFRPPPGFDRALLAAPLSVRLSLQPLAAFSTFSMVGNEWHGPEAPGPDWVETKSGPHGGKRWVNLNGGVTPALEPTAAKPLTSSAAPTTAPIPTAPAVRASYFAVPAGFPRPKKHNVANLALPDASRPTLDLSEAMGLRTYCNRFYSTINDAYRTGKPVNEKVIKADADLRKAFDKLEDFPTPVLVRRGLDLGKGAGEFLAKLEAARAGGEAVPLLGHISTSTPGEVKFTGNFTLNIAARRGLDAQPYSNYDERELLLESGSLFKVHNITSEIHPITGAIKYTVNLEQAAGPVLSRPNLNVIKRKVKAAPPAAVLPKDEPALDVGKTKFPATSELFSLVVVKKLGGSTGAKLVQDSQGNQFVMKAAKKTKNGQAHLREEAAADASYRALGIAVPDGRLYETTDGPVKLTAFEPDAVPLSQFRAYPAEYQEAAFQKVRQGFVADALLRNWDVLGQDYDNVLFNKTGQPLRVDNGGALRHRAQGKLKDRSTETEAVYELDTMRDPLINPGTAEVFKSITIEEITAQVRSIYGKRDALLAALPEAVRPNMGARLEWLKKKYGSNDAAT